MLKSESKFTLWGVYLFYALTIALGLSRHELWGDELQSWNLAKGSTDFMNLLSTIRYEGHPPVWYALLWGISKLTHNVIYIQYLHFAIAMVMAGSILFLSPFPVILRVLMVFGYYFIFEYAVLSRNYAIGAVFVFLAMYFQGSDLKYKRLGYYSMLFLASNTHLLACALAVCIHIGFVLGSSPKKVDWKYLFSFIIFLPAAYFIFPPADSGSGFLLNKWRINQLVIFFHVPLKSFFSIPAWWDYHFWNSNILLDEQAGPQWLRNILVLFLSLVILALIIYLLFDNLKSRYLILSSIIITYLLNVLMPLTSMRYAGFFYLSFLCALWFAFGDGQCFSRIKRILLYIIVIIQIPRGFFSLYKDWVLPFSLSKTVLKMSSKIPAKESVIATYWCINNLSTYLDAPYYCLETRKMERFIKWDSNLKMFLLDPLPYKNGLDYYFSRNSIKNIYLFSTVPTSVIAEIDTLAVKQYDFQLLDKREGAIDRSGNVYLYLVSIKR